MDKVINLIEKVTNTDLKDMDVSQINPDNISEWDSLTHLQLIMLIEEEFNIEISPDQIVEMFKGYDSIEKILKDHGVQNI